MLYDVAIVGYGPVGAVLANLLGQAGLSIIVFERDPGVHPLPRAVHFDGEVMRVFQAAGLADSIAAVTRPSIKGMHFINGEGRTLMVRRGREGIGPQGWTSNWYFHQPYLEEALRVGVKRFPNVEVRLRHEVFAIDEKSDHAVLRVENLANGTLGESEARYVVGCDGARSLVRRLIGSTYEDLGLHQPWLVVDMLMKPESARGNALPDYTIQHCDPARPMTECYIGGESPRRRRWEIMLLPGDEPQSMLRPERIWQVLSSRVAPDDAEIERAALYTFHSVVARGWRRGRLMIAGDSAHQTPPFLGQGMCAGLRDAANLAWRLDMVLRGASDSLLDSYESERRPHVHAFIDLAVKLGAVIQETDPVVAEKRDREFAGGEPKMFDFPQPQLGTGVFDRAPPPVGVVFPQLLLPDGRKLDEAIGNRFALIGEAATIAQLASAARARLDVLGAAVIDRPGEEIEAWLAEQGAHALILRPDRYVLGIARNAEELASLCSMLPVPAAARKAA